MRCVADRRDLLSMLIKDTDRAKEVDGVSASLLAVLVVSVLLAALARRFDVSAPLALVVAGLRPATSPGCTTSSSTPSWCCS